MKSQLAFAVATFMAACEGPPGPVEVCRDFAAELCEREQQCQVAPSAEDCAEVYEAFVCDHLAGVLNGPLLVSECLPSLPSWPCEALREGDIPSACLGQFVIRLDHPDGVYDCAPSPRAVTDCPPEPCDHASTRLRTMGQKRDTRRYPLATRVDLRSYDRGSDAAVSR